MAEAATAAVDTTTAGGNNFAGYELCTGRDRFRRQVFQAVAIACCAEAGPQ